MDISLGKLLGQQEGPVLITGHTGFKGTWLTLLLENLGVRVVGLSLPPLSHSLYSLAGRANKIQEFFGISKIKDTKFV